MTNLTEIVDKFRIDGIVKSIDPLGSGLINDTYKITTQSSDTDTTFFNGSTMLFLKM